MSTISLAALPPPSRGAALLRRLNGPLHRRALWAFMAVVLMHWAEHLFQAWQICTGCDPNRLLLGPVTFELD